VYLRRNSEFCEPNSVNGISHRSSLLVGNRSDPSVLGKSIHDAKDKFFVTVRCEHWAKQISMISQKGRRESGGLDGPESEVVPAEFVCLWIFSAADIVDRNFDDI